MRSRKKLQVFVSSTYADLKEERQAAVEAILTGGHIPAGMELFAAGDESQMAVIRRWIEESDVYLLILGGRYGSIEPGSGKSYTHLEYEYALQIGKPLFAVVIDEAALEKRVKRAGSKAMETDNAGHLREFRKLVLSRVVRFWTDARDIKLAILEKLSEFSARADLVGWVPGDQVISTGLVAEELARIAKENGELRQQLAASAPSSVTYNGLTFEQYTRLLANETMDLRRYVASERPWVAQVPRALGEKATLLQLVWVFQNAFLAGVTAMWQGAEYILFRRLVDLGLLRSDEPPAEVNTFQITADGRKFILRLIAEQLLQETEEFRDGSARQIELRTILPV